MILARPTDEPLQLELNLYPDETLDLDGKDMDIQGGVTFVGRAKKNNEGNWTCLAHMHTTGALVVIELRPKKGS